MSGVVAGDEEREDLNGVLRTVLLAAQRLLRERFENRVAWVDGRWVWRREVAGAPPLPPEARKKVADVSRLLEILTNAQFRDRSPHNADHKQSPVASAPQPLQPYKQQHWRPNILGAGGPPSSTDSPVAVCAMLIVATFAVWLSAAVFLSYDGNRRRVRQLKQRINGWFSKKAAAAAAADGEAEGPTLPGDDPPPPYCAGSAEPFLAPRGAGGAGGAGGDLPPPYSCAAPRAQRRSLAAAAGAAVAASELSGARGAPALSDGCGAGAGKTDDEGCSTSDGREAFCDESLVVVV